MSIILIRTVLLYLLIIFSLRIMGKRQIGELQPSDLVITILISNLAAVPIEEPNNPLSSGIVPILALVSFEIIISVISLKSKKFRRIVSGEPVYVVKNGQLCQDAMKKLRFSIDDLFEELRGIGIFDLDEVEFAVVETNGKFNAYKKQDDREATVKDLKGMGKNCSAPFIIINDGKLNRTGIENCGVNELWVKKQLKKKGVCEKDVFLMTCDMYQNVIMIEKSKGG